ncbi:MAG TPA: hypothetical protein VKE95_15630 [Burkholderiales bacterium]|nr:hypothetical protein [Burkholderiales bacterium]
MAVSDQQLPDDRNQLAFVQRWRAVIDTQMHFNDMLMRTRSIGLSMVIAVYGAAIVSAGQYPDSTVTFFAYRLHVGVGIFFVGMLLLVSLFLLDRCYYFRMLIATVELAEEIERESGSAMQPIELKLTQHVSASVSRRTASLVLWLFYAVPFLIGLLFLTGLVVLKSQ